MNYETEELIPIVRKLAADYTGLESTSVTYERAEQLMGAVLYCIHEAERFGGGTAVRWENVSARQVYEAGVRCTEERVREAMALYHELLPEFSSWGNRCLEDTFLKGIPDFFKWYDVKFDPQNTILTLDYPVLKDLSGSSGIDRICGFLECIRLEQQFLKQFPERAVRDALEEYDCRHEALVENVCEMFLSTVLGRLLKGKAFAGYLAGTVGEIALRLKQ